MPFLCKTAENNRNIGISRWKIFFPATLLIIAICTSMGIYAYNCIHDAMVEMGVEEAGMAAQVVVDILDADILGESL